MILEVRGYEIAYQAVSQLMNEWRASYQPDNLRGAALAVSWNPELLGPS